MSNLKCGEIINNHIYGILNNGFDGFENDCIGCAVGSILGYDMCHQCDNYFENILATKVRLTGCDNDDLGVYAEILNISSLWYHDEKPMYVCYLSSAMFDWGDASLELNPFMGEFSSDFSYILKRYNELSSLHSDGYKIFEFTSYALTPAAIKDMFNIE